MYNHPFLQLPDEVTLNIIDNLSILQQARLAHVCKYFRALTYDYTTKLSNTINLAPYGLQIGNLSFRITQHRVQENRWYLIKKQELRALLKKESEFVLCLTKGQELLAGTSYSTSSENLMKFKEVIMKDICEENGKHKNLIDFLKKDGITARLIATHIEQEIQTYKTQPNSASSKSEYIPVIEVQEPTEATFALRCCSLM
jgi:hypothetical protein